LASAKSLAHRAVSHEHGYCIAFTKERIRMHLFDYLDSGNGFKVRLLLAQLGQKYDWTHVDIDQGLTRTPEFLKRNPNGRIPTLQLDDGTYLFESNAILWYLAEGSPFVPSTRRGRGQVLQWMFFEPYIHEPYVATPR
jgi:glutathione S-transferase